MWVSRSGIGRELVLRKDGDVERQEEGTGLLCSGGSIICYDMEVLWGVCDLGLCGVSFVDKSVVGGV